MANFKNSTLRRYFRIVGDTMKTDLFTHRKLKNSTV